MLHFAARNRLFHLFTVLVALPGGRQALSLTDTEGKVPLDLAQENGVQEVIDIINGYAPLISCLLIYLIFID